MSIHISCDMYLRLGLHVQIRLYYVFPYEAKISAQDGIGFILDRCIVYLGLTMPNLQKKRLLIFEIFNIKKCTLFFGTEYINNTFSSKIMMFNHLPHMPIVGSSNSAVNKDIMSKIWTNRDKIVCLSRKHCGKRRNCSLRSISCFSTMFSKAVRR